jgi:hypothetical protein
MLAVGILNESLCHFDEQLGILLARTGQCRSMLITALDSDGGSELAEHPWILRRLQGYAGLEVVACDGPVRPLDWLFIHLWEHKRPNEPTTRRWLKAAKRVACISAADFSPGWRSVARGLIRGFPYYIGARAVILQCQEGVRHPYPFIPCQVHYTPTVHPQFYTVPEYETAMFAPRTDRYAPRRFVLSFVGSRTPRERELVLRRIQAHLSKIDSLEVHIDDSISCANGHREVLWIEYDVSEGSHGLSPVSYVKVLDDSEFCICPRGWGGWTHRVIEALLRGSIPILDDEKLYNLGLKHGVNCLVPERNNWAEAINVALNLSVSEVAAMRTRIAELVAARIAPEAAATRLFQRLGFEDQSAS